MSDKYYEEALKQFLNDSTIYQPEYKLKAKKLNLNIPKMKKENEAYFKQFIIKDAAKRREIAETYNDDNFFIQEREKFAKEVKTCQSDKKLKTCNKCDDVIECKLRNDYVEYVYLSLTNGKTDGAFNFDPSGE